MNNLPPGIHTLPVSDRARRASDICNSYRTFVDWEELKTKWVAIRLSDGGHDGVLYDNRRDAIRHQMHEQQCLYVSFHSLVGGTRPEEMERVLLFQEKAYDAGMRLIDPDDAHGGPEIAPTAARMDDFNNRQFLPLLHQYYRRGGK